MPLASKPGAPRPPRPEPPEMRARRCLGIWTREGIEASYRAGHLTKHDYDILIGFCDELAAKAAKS